MVDAQRNVRLIDFGYSSCVNTKQDLIASYSGTPVYLAPEIIKKMPYNGNYNKDSKLIFGHSASYFIECLLEIIHLSQKKIRHY